MDKYLNDDTIVAISTAPVIAAIGVVRLSGKNSIDICNKVFSKNLYDCKSSTAVHGYIKDTQNSIVDEVVLTVFRAPKSYTGEDTVEISCHGSMYVLGKVVELLILSGARQALNGEFTKRAFINGKMDLAQAESVIDLIESETEDEAVISSSGVRGILSSEIGSVRNELVDLSAEILAFIDYPDDDIADVSHEHISSKVNESLKIINELESTYKNSQLIKNGINIVICGRPNVGKSMLMNKLLGYERSIVTDISGTTRDIVEDSVLINGIKFVISDTAGIHDSNDSVEKIGIERANDKIQHADLIVCVFDCSDELLKEDLEIIEKIRNYTSKKIAVVNKVDLSKKINIDEKNIFDSVMYVSAKDNIGIDELKTCLTTSVGYIKPMANDRMIMNIRQYECIVRAKKSLQNALSNIELTCDAVLIDISDAIESLGEVTGKTVNSEIIDNIFSRFCVGK